MKKCMNCGYEGQDEALFCVKCGVPFQAQEAQQEAPAPQPAEEPKQQAASEAPQYRMPPQYMPPVQQCKEEPISLGKWLLYHLIPYAGLVVPILGNLVYIVVLFIWAFNGTDEAKNNTTFRNWARAQLIFQGVSLVLGIILVAFIMFVLFSGFGAIGGELWDELDYYFSY